MKKPFSNKRSIFITVSIVTIAVLICLGGLMYQSYISSRTVNGRLIDESDYIGLTGAEAKKKLDKDNIHIKFEEIDGNRNIPNTAEGSCNGYMWVAIHKDRITSARFEPGDPSC